MSYVPDNKQIQEPIDQIIEGIDKFIAVANNRIDSSEDWDEMYRRELSLVLPNMIILRSQLAMLE